MSRRHAPDRKWHVGDKCLWPVYLRIQSSGKSIVRWSPGEVVAVRDGKVVVRQYIWETEYNWWEIKPVPRHRGRAWQHALRWGQSRHRRTV